MLETELQMIKYLNDLEEMEVNQEGYSLSIIRETNINFLFIKQEIQYLEYLSKTLGCNYKYYQTSHLD